MIMISVSMSSQNIKLIPLLVSKIFAKAFLGVTNSICILQKGITAQKTTVSLDEKN